MKGALGLIETVGLTAAAAALDEALDTADVVFVGSEKVIGVGKSVSVTVHIAGDVAAVQAAVEAGKEAAERVGTVMATLVLPRPHEDVQKLVERFKKQQPVKKNTKKKETPKAEANKEGNKGS